MIEYKTFICEFCGNEFTLSHKLYGKNKDKIIKYCSKECAASAIILQKRPNFYSKKELIRHIEQIIQKNNRYTTTQEVIDELHISCKTLTKYKISILQINKSLGYKKPQSMFEYLVGMYIDELFKDVEYQKTFPDCLSPKGYELRYDFYISSCNLLIEADGTQHYDKTNPNYNEYASMCDDIKDKYALDNNINLIRIPYIKKVTKQYVLNYLRQLDPLNYNVG